MLRSTLRGDQGVEVREPGEKRLLTAVGMVQGFHHDQLPLDGVVGLVSQRAGHGHLGLCEHGILARFLGLELAPDPLPVGGSGRGGDGSDKVAEPLPQRQHPQVLAPPDTVPQGVALHAACLPHRRRDGHQFLRELEKRVAETGADTGSREERAQALGHAGAPVAHDAADPRGWLLVHRCPLARLIRRGKGWRTGLRRRAEVPEDTAGDNRGQLPLVGQTRAGRFIGQARDRPWEATPGQHRHQALRPKGTEQARERHGGERIEHRAALQPEATVWGDEGITGDLRAPPAIA
jgi:hypothetical protein